MPGKKATEIVGEIVDLLTPIESDERLRIIQASLTLLGEASTGPALRDGSNTGMAASVLDQDSSLPPRAQVWAKQHGVSPEQLQQVFHFDADKVELIAGEIAGKNKKDKTLNAYILAGLTKFLSTGNATFDDKSARGLCVSSGCYDESNHAATIKDRGNEFTGTKENGWTLTAPGLKHAAALVKEIAKV